MTTASLYATSLVAGTVATSANALGAPNGTWTTNADNSSWDARFALDTIPAGQILSGTQTITVRVRKETGTGTPTLTVELWEAGVFVTTIASDVNITSTTGQDVGLSFGASTITDPDQVEVRVIGTQSGGGPSARSTPQIDGITWTAQYVATPNEGAATTSTTWAGTAAGERAPEGSATSGVAWSGTVSGATDRQGSATGSVQWPGAASGETPPDGPNQGSAIGTCTWAGAAGGTAPHAGSATTSTTWAGDGAGSATHQGAAGSSLAWSASAVGPSSGPNSRTVNYIVLF